MWLLNISDVKLAAVASMTKAISHTSPHKELPPKKTKISKASHKIKHDAEKKSKHVVSKEASLKKKSDNNQRDKLTAQKLESPVKHASRKRKMKKPKAKLKESRDSEAVETNTHTDVSSDTARLHLWICIVIFFQACQCVKTVALSFLPHENPFVQLLFGYLSTGCQPF